MQKVRTWSAVLLGPVDQLGLIDHVGDVLKDLCGQLHTDADTTWLLISLIPRSLHWLANHSAPDRPGAAIR